MRGETRDITDVTDVLDVMDVMAVAKLRRYGVTWKWVTVFRKEQYVRGLILPPALINFFVGWLKINAAEWWADSFNFPLLEVLPCQDRGTETPVVTLFDDYRSEGPSMNLGLYIGIQVAHPRLEGAVNAKLGLRFINHRYIR
jgi:hypothetical protein